MDNENQHFVPRSFLKNFCINGTSEIYLSRFIEHNKKWTNPISRHIRSICYLGDIYDLSPDLAEKKGISTDFVERNAFWYEKDYLENLILKIENESIEQSDIKELPDFYMSMIARNPVFMTGFNPHQIQTLLDKFLTKARKESEFIKKMANLGTDEELEIWFANMRSKFLSEQTQQRMFSSSVYKQHIGESNVYNSIRNKIEGYKIIVGRIKEEGEFFITSDSPGFSVCEKGGIYSLKFKDDISHYMPISSKVFIALQNPVYALNAPKLSIIDVTSEIVQYINNGSISASNGYVFCENKEYLSNHMNNRLGK